jgi:hypothetical protein
MMTVMISFGTKIHFSELNLGFVSNQQILGDTMARCYIKFETMQNFAELARTTTFSELVHTCILIQPT